MQNGLMPADIPASGAAHPGPARLSTVRFSELADRLLDLPGPSRIVAVDGPGGAGKTTFAKRLSVSTSAETITLHTDEFATPDLPTAWWPRLRTVVESLVSGGSATFEPYDWAMGALAPARTVRPVELVIIEGVSSSRTEWAEHLAFSIWIDASPEVCRSRGVSRDGIDPDEWDIEARSEAAFFARDGTYERADLIVDSAASLDSEITIVVQSSV